MGLYIAIEDGAPAGAPVDELTLRRRYPEKSLPARVDAATLAALGLAHFADPGPPATDRFQARPAPRPVFDPDTRTVTVAYAVQDRPLAEAQAVAREALLARAAEVRANVLVKGVWWCIGEDTFGVLDATRRRLEADPGREAVRWPLRDGQVARLSAAELETMVVNLLDRSEAIIDRTAAFRTAIGDAGSVDDLRAIVARVETDANWPDPRILE